MSIQPHIHTSQRGLIVLQVASTSMELETQDTRKDILIILAKGYPSVLHLHLCVAHENLLGQLVKP